MVRLAVGWFGVYLVSAFIGAVVGFPVFGLGLIMAAFIGLPLWLAMVAVLSTLAAGWTSNLLVAEGAYTRFLPSLVLPLAVSLALAAVILALEPTMARPLLLGSPLVLLVSLLATLSTAVYRREERRLGSDAVISAGMLGALLLAVVGALVLAALLGLLGA